MGTELNPRQQWIVKQLREGVAVERVMVERQFGIGEKTAKRDLAELARRGFIEFQRQGRTGFYRRTATG